MQVYLREKCGAKAPCVDARIAAVKVDLRGTGAEDFLVYLEDEGFCGTGGCPLLILERPKGGFRMLAHMTVALMPVAVMRSKTEGLFDIAVTSRNYKSLPYTDYFRLRFRKGRYPSNPSAQRRASRHELVGSHVLLTEKTQLVRVLP